jgi:hypothetical protein
MGKTVKLLVSIFVGLDVSVAAYFGLANLRVAVFGWGSIPGGGSAIDMAFFLIPLLLGWIAGDRFYYFLTYKERKATCLGKSAIAPEKPVVPDAVRREEAAIWEDRGWEEPAQDTTINTSSKSVSPDSRV